MDSEQLYRMTLCEHGFREPHSFHNYGTSASSTRMECSGGVYEVANPDYNLAYNTAVSEGINILPSQFDELKITVNAALGITEAPDGQ